MEQPIEIEGRILAVLAGTMFRVELTNKHQVLAHISGKNAQNASIPPHHLATGSRWKCPRTISTRRAIVYRLQ